MSDEIKSKYMEEFIDGSGDETTPRNPKVREAIEKITREIMYEEKTVARIEDTIKKLKDLLGPDYVISYTIPENKTGSVEFVMGKKLGGSNEYTLWTVEVGPEEVA